MKKQLHLTGWYLRRTWLFLVPVLVCLVSFFHGWNTALMRDANGVYSYQPVANPELALLRTVLGNQEMFLVLGGAAALVLHWDDMTARRAELLASLPVRREEQFLARLLAGAVLLALPLLPVTLIPIITTKAPVFSGIAFLFSWLTCLEGLAGGTLACTLCGTRRGAVLTWISSTLCITVLPNIIQFRTPIFPLQFLVNRLSPNASMRYAIKNVFVCTDPTLALHNTKALLAGLGLRMVWCAALLVLALVLVRKKPVECVGSFSAVPGLKQVLRWLLLLLYCRLWGGMFARTFLELTGQLEIGMILFFVLLGPPVFRFVLDLLTESPTGFRSRIPRMLAESCGATVLCTILSILLA